MKLRKSGGNHCHVNAIAVPGARARAQQPAVPGHATCSLLLSQLQFRHDALLLLKRAHPAHPHWSAAAAAADARQAFERAAEKAGFSFTHLPKVTGDAALREQLKAAGARGRGLPGARAPPCWPGLLPLCARKPCRPHSLCSLRGARSTATHMHARTHACLPSSPPHRTYSFCPTCSSPVGEGEYFLALLPDGSRLVHPIAFGERHPLNFGREVLAELAGEPER